MWADTYEILAESDALRLRSLQEPELEIEVTLAPVVRLVARLAWPPSVWEGPELEEALVTLEETRPANVRAHRLSVGQLEISLWVYAEDLTRQGLNLAVSELAVARRLLLRRRDRLSVTELISEPWELKPEDEPAEHPASSDSAADEDERKRRLRRPANHWMPPPLAKKARNPVPDDPGFNPRPLPKSGPPQTFNPFAEDE